MVTGNSVNNVNPAPLQFGYQSTQNPYTMMATAEFASGTVGPVASTLYCWPFIVSTQTLFTKIGVNQSSAGTASNLRMGIYLADGTGGRIKTLLVDAGTVSISGSNGDVTITISQNLYGAYWLVYIPDGTPGGLRNTTVNALKASVAFGNVTTSGTGVVAMTEASVASYFTALPSDLSGDTFTYSTSAVPGIFLK